PNLTIPLSKYHLSTLFSALEKRKVNLDSTVIINNEYAKQFKIKKFLLTFLNNLKKNNNVILATV
ncbi:MAG TPA: hypothetical protein PLG90_06530, partial [Ignavibacteria bacterium]|nr:hypothetical protein [Ignavibacteria bacterium]